MRRLLLLIPSLVTVLACADAPPVTAPAESTLLAVTRLEDYNAREAWQMNLLYTCSPPVEMVHLTGTLHTISKMFIDGNGTEHWSFHSHPVQLHGVGAVSGRTFKVVGAENTNRVIHEDGYRRFLQTARLRLMGPRDTPAWTIKVNVYRERTPPGPWEWKIDRWEVECQ